MDTHYCLFLVSDLAMAIILQLNRTKRGDNSRAIRINLSTDRTNKHKKRTITV